MTKDKAIKKILDNVPLAYADKLSRETLERMAIELGYIKQK